MKKPSLIILLLVLALAVLSLQFLGPDSGFAPGEPPPIEAVDPDDAALVVPDVAVRDLDGRVAWRGDVDLAPELERIAAGERDPHRNDGGVFQNREGLLPDRPRGHYREYVVRTPDISHAGPQRLVIGADGEVYYTHDHYQSFRRIR
ncbi:MAG: ribonuclease [Thioalkalivibrio sp.]|nr:MAG: ribonuclease [Thioalkalivibrio sp.]